MSEAAERELVDWKEFVLRICVEASPENVYLTWTAESGLARWFLATAKFRPDGRWRDPDEPTRSGDAYEWTWLGNKNSFLEGRILTADGVGRFAFTFGDAAQVGVVIRPRGNRTLVELTQSHMPDTPEGRSDYLDCYGGWTFYLSNLKSVLESGIDLRERDPEVWDVVNR